MRNEITCIDHFRSVLMSLLDRAKRCLENDDDLQCTALIRSNTGMQQVLGLNVSIDQLADAVRHRVAEHPHSEYVVFLGLVLIRGDGTDATSYTVVRRYSEFRATGGPAAMAILIEGSHRDFGEHAAHICFNRIGEKRFSFSEAMTGEMKTSRTLAGLWPKRRLNS